jgi:hypothetical protein
VARLAAVLALLDWTANRPSNAPPPSVIKEQHLLAAWDLWQRYYRPHAAAVFDRAGPSDRDRQLRRHARQAIGWIRAQGASEVSREDVRREALSQRVRAAGADEVIAALEQAGVLREVEDDDHDEAEHPRRGRPARRWQVNPALIAKSIAQIAEKKTMEGEGSDPRSDALSARVIAGEEESEVGHPDWPK